MLEVSKSFPAYQFVVAKAPGQEENFYDELLKNYPNVSSVSDKTYDLLMQIKSSAGHIRHGYPGNGFVWGAGSSLL